ncbi:MAG TPA: L,D-transpeptidase/peptidoglycan binding protein [Candidatus Blautia faecigallinarum]|uniref:L,D-transpeptidase/peptidoglycan binding protein n=1 Tax=Candidatus Blautia faecigallinarum TaxID=2838488 RepID=A0A9D2DUI0_9FIRM|nr:L,D-transpeptidase/peptidoglycan binding protein [Candidatus Blautia faecigallinarum]
MKKISTVSRKTQKRILILCLAAVVLLGAGMLIYIKVVDTNTMGRGISICGLNVSRLTPEKAAQKIADTFQDRTVRFIEDGKEVTRVTFGQLGYTLDSNALLGQLEDLKAERSQHTRLLSVKEDYPLELPVQRNEEAEKAALSADRFADKERTSSTDASIQYDKEQKKFTLIKAVQGNQIDEEKLLSKVRSALDKEFKDSPLGGEVAVTLDESVYQSPSSSVTDQMKHRLTSLNTLLKNYRNASVTYTFGSEEKVLDPATVRSWIKIEEAGVSIDEEAVRNYVSQLAAEYNTIYVPRSFHTTYGSDITIDGNEYGFQIDQEGEVSQLLADLKSGTPVRREPVYSIRGMQRNGKDDLAGSYIEVSLNDQHLWLYKDGALVTETDIISGRPGEETETYRGAWPIAYKASPFTLSSDMYGYEIEVQYWMPFVYGQGLHDASWQSSFGGNSYRTGAGSHGCINLPTDQAALIYNTIDGGYPIIIY